MPGPGSPEWEQQTTNIIQGAFSDPDWYQSILNNPDFINVLNEDVSEGSGFTMREVLVEVRRIADSDLSDDDKDRAITAIRSKPGAAVGTTSDWLKKGGIDELQESFDQLAEDNRRNTARALSNLYGEDYARSEFPDLFDQPTGVDKLGPGVDPTRFDPGTAPDVGGTAGEGRAFFEGEIERLGGFLDDPSKLRSDPELAKRLAEVERAIKGQLGVIRGTEAKRVASTGARASGKSAGRLAQAETLGAFKRGENVSNILGEVGAAKTGLETGLINFNERVGALESGILGGQFGGDVGLTQFRSQFETPDFTGGPMMGFDLSGYADARGQTEFGNLMNFLNLVVGGGNQLASTVGQGIATFAG